MNCLGCLPPSNEAMAAAIDAQVVVPKLFGTVRATLHFLCDDGKEPFAYSFQREDCWSLVVVAQ
eukprot:4248673-Amphidinium_carterae.1